MANVIILGDTHLPFVHPDYLEFCKEVEREFDCGKVMHIGDLVDNHSISFHEHNPDGRSSGDEVKQARRELRKWFRAFPKVSLCKGNHDVLANRRAIEHGISEEYLRDFEEVWQLPRKWIYKWYFKHGNVRYEHGTGYSGQTAHIKAAMINRQSTVIGHCHSVGGSSYFANDLNMVFGLSVGCGIERKQYAFWYGKDFKEKPILGCGVVLEGGKEGYFIPMKL